MELYLLSSCMPCSCGQGRLHLLVCFICLACIIFVITSGLSVGVYHLSNIYRISRTIRRTFFPKKCDLKSTCVLYAEGKYLFPNL